MDKTASRQTLYLIFICSVAALGGFLFGLDAIIISGTVGLVRAQFSLTSAAEGLFVSASLIGCAVGAFIAGPFADRFGRRASLIGAGLLTLAGVALCTMAMGPSALIITRLLGGLGVGVASMTCPLYVAEVAPRALRGRLVSLYQLAITIGILAALLSNAALLALATRSPDDGGLIGWILVREPWRAMFGVQIVPALGFALLALLLPESPRWLVSRDARTEARRVLNALMPPSAANAALAEMIAVTEPAAGYSAVLMQRYRRPLIVALGLAMLSELSGITVVFYYGPQLLEAAGAKGVGALGGFAILGVINMAATLIAVWLIDRVGRRTLLAVGSAGAFVCLLALGLLMTLPSPPLAALVGLICVFVTVFAFSIGPIKFVVASEIFPARVRARGTAIAVTAVWLTGAAINQIFPLVRDHYGAAAMFIGFALAPLAQLIFIKTVMPETAGQSLEEIEAAW